MGVPNAMLACGVYVQLRGGSMYCMVGYCYAHSVGLCRRNCQGSPLYNPYRGPIWKKVFIFYLNWGYKLPGYMEKAVVYMNYRVISLYKPLGRVVRTNR